MTPRQRRAARRRAIRKQWPIGRRWFADKEHPSQAGEWFVYGHKGQDVLMRRKGSATGYAFHSYELRHSKDVFRWLLR